MAQKAASLTPMLRHYLEVKAQHPDALLLYRMGDFFELFFEDAEIAAPVLEVALTARQRGTPGEAAMCGVPHHAVDGYIGKLLDAGFKVAVCDQVEDPAEAKGLFRREVVRVVTPGTVSEPELLDGKRSNLLAAVLWQGGAGAGAFLDISTGEFFVRRWLHAEEALDDLTLFRPREALYREGELPSTLAAWLERSGVCRTPLAAEELLGVAEATRRLERQFEIAALAGLGLADGELAIAAAAAALEYARRSARSDLAHVRSLTVRQAADFVALDEATLRNLEVFESLRERRSRSGTLLWVMDQTATAGGSRLLRDWLAHPLRDLDAIELRQAAVGELLEQASVRERVRTQLGRIADLERLVARSVLGSLSPREAAALRDSLLAIPELLAHLADREADLLAELASTDRNADLAERLRLTLEETPHPTLRDGGVIAAGVDAELDRCRSLAQEGKRHALAFEARERAATGIGSLKVRFNRVFGYYIEVTKSNQGLVPERYLRKQTLANAERYFTAELKELEEQILEAEQRQVSLEEQLYLRLVGEVAVQAVRLRELAHAVATLDVLASFAEVAARRDYRRPRLVAGGGDLRIRDGRHPVVEALSSSPFVPNDTDLEAERSQIVLLTGPNMGGKSTYLRQVALIVLLAHTGSFVPAAEAEIAVVDRIFTRVGASDDLARGQSTFMVEMIETANILRYAGPESLVVLDEVGRGTATFDGLSLAWAIVEYLHERSRAKTLFATHYHELTELRALLGRVVNRTMAVREWQDRIVFLHRVVDGSADKSYGIQVARLAGVPEEVLERAAEILGNLEAQEYDMKGKPRLARGHPPASTEPDQLGLFDANDEWVVEVLRDLDLERLTPLAALNLLATLKQRL